MRCFRKNSITLCIVITLCFSLSVPATANDNPIFSLWASEEVTNAADAELLPFEMYGDCRRAIHREWGAAFLVKLVETAIGGPIKNYGTGTFTDVASYNPNLVAIEKAYVIGITKGTGDGTTFEPLGDVTREEYAVMLCRSLAYIENSLGKEILTSSSDLTGFSDGNTVSEWAEESLSSLINTGLYKGTALDTISPLDAISIEQAILLSYRSLLLIQSAVNS